MTVEVINVLFEGEVIAVETQGVTFVSQLVTKGVQQFQLQRGITIRGGLNAFRVTLSGQASMFTNPLHVPAKHPMNPAEAVDRAPFEGGNHVVMLERRPMPVSAALAALAALAGGAGVDDAGGPDAAPALSISEFAGPAFEGEARAEINNIMRDLCPWMADHSGLQSRHLDRGGSRRQADIFCYVTEAGTAASVSVPTSGLRVLQPDASIGTLPAATAMPVPAGQRFSPINATRTGPQKCFLAEAYSGDSDVSRVAKLGQLETLVAFTISRWQDRQGVAASAVPDITSIVGMAGLVFSAITDRRIAVLDEACAMVQTNAGPHIRRLIRAGRFFVMVLDRSQTPMTNMAREQAAMGEELRLHRKLLARIPEEVADLVVARLGAVSAW